MNWDNKELRQLAELLAENVSGADIIAARELGKISAQLSTWRINHEMTQKEFATLLGVTQGMVSRWESEDYNFSIETLAKIADKLDLQLEITLKPSLKTYSMMQMFEESKWNVSGSTEEGLGGAA